VQCALFRYSAEFCLLISMLHCPYSMNRLSSIFVLAASACSAVNGAFAVNVIWDGSAGDDSFINAANWNVSGVDTLPGESGDPLDNAIIQNGDVPALIGAQQHDPGVVGGDEAVGLYDITVRNGSGLIVDTSSSDAFVELNAISLGRNGTGALSTVSHTNGAVDATAVFIGGVSSGSARYEISGGSLESQQFVQIDEGGVFQITGQSAMVSLGSGGAAVNPGLGDLRVNAGGTLKFTLGTTGVSAVAVSSDLEVDAAASLVIDCNAYTGGVQTIPLVNIGGVGGVSGSEFTPENISIVNLDASLTAEITYGSDRMDLVLASDPFGVENSKVEALGGLTTAPAVYTDDQTPGAAAIIASTNARQEIYFDALDYKGNPTRVYAYIDIPDTATVGNPVPGVVLVHGGGGSAFSEWVDRWVARGYAAISIAVEGQSEETTSATAQQIANGEATSLGYLKHGMSGPERVAIYHDSAEALEDQWMYHAVADTVLANSLMRSLPEVDASKVGIMGVSWGGVITSTAIGIDDRFAFAIATYGCGHKYDIPNQYGSALVDNQLYRKVWDPILRMDQATMPSMWLSWPEENNFSLDAQAATYHRVGGSYVVSLIPGLGHGHPFAWMPDDSYEFANSVLASGGDAWCEQQALSLTGSNAEVTFRSDKPLASAELIYTSGTGFTGDLSWLEQVATLIDNTDGTWTVTATLPAGTTAWAVSVESVELGTDGVPLIASSDYKEINSISFEPSSLLELDLETGVDGSTAEARMVFSGPTHAEITEFSITGESHAGSFSVLTAAPLVLDDPSLLGTPVSIQFDNTVAGLSLSESATATLSVSLEELDGTINQFTLPLSATVRTPRSVVFDTSSYWSSEQPIYSVDDVFIRNDATVILDAADVVASLTVADETSPTTGALSLNSGARFQVLETLTLGASSGAGVVNQSSGFVSVDTLDINANGAGDSSQYNLSGGSLYADQLLVNANGELNMTGGDLALDLSYAVSVNGDLTIDGGAFISTISGLSPVFNGTGSISLSSGSFSMNGGVGADVIQFNQSSIEISGGALDLSGQLYVSGATDFVVIGDSASIEIERLAATSAGTFRFVFGATGVSTIDIDYFMGLANAQVEIDGSAYTDGEGTFTLFDATNLTALLNPSNVSITGFDLQNKDAYVVQDQTNGTDWVQLVVEELLSNGVTQRWMRENGLPETNEATQLDSDGDGRLNWEELEAGTDPNDSSSTFVVEQVDLSEEQLTVYWQAVSGKTYVLQHKADLADPLWTAIRTNLLGVEPQSSVTVDVSGTQGFYQISVE